MVRLRSRSILYSLQARAHQGWTSKPFFSFRNNSQVSSRDVSPKTKSPTDSYFNFQSGTNSSLKSNKSSDDTSNHSANNITDIEVYDYDADMDVEHNTFRICVLGETGVGKTALVNQFLTSEHMNTYDASLGKIT